MLGNSLIRRGNWDSLLKRNDVINRGISGDKLRCICERLSYLKGLNASICFIEGGINDIPGVNTDSLFKYYKSIINFFIQQKMIPVINLVLYISPKAGNSFPSRKDYHSINLQVKALNDKLREYAVKNKIDFIDENKDLCNEELLVLKDENTWDGVHLTPPAYKKWTAAIQSILKKYKL